MKEKMFVCLRDGNDPVPRFVNLEHITMAILEEDRLVLKILGNITVNILGPAQVDLYTLIMSHSVFPDGEPPTDMLERIKTKVAAVKSGS